LDIERLISLFFRFRILPFQKVVFFGQKWVWISQKQTYDNMEVNNDEK
jgi:hypothetical protein